MRLGESQAYTMIDFVSYLLRFLKILFPPFREGGTVCIWYPRCALFQATSDIVRFRAQNGMTEPVPSTVSWTAALIDTATLT